MALYDTRFGLPQSMVDYLNQGLPSIQQPYRPGYDKNYGPGEGTYTTVMPKPGYEYVYGPDGQRYSIPIQRINPIRPSPDDPEGIKSLYPEVVESGGGDGFNPYDIRPGDSSIRTPDQYSPYAYNQAMRNTEKFGQTVGPNPDLYYAPQTGIEQLLSKIPTPLGLIKKGLDAFGNNTVNEAAIFQNELLGQGIKLDNIGRIVTDNYNTPEGIMAGYNPVSGGLLNMLTGGAYGEPTQYGLANAVAERQSNIRDTLQDKYGLSNEQIEDVLSEIEETGTYTGPLGFNQTMGKTTNLFKNLLSQSAKPTNIYNYPPGSFEDDYYNRLAEKGILEYGTADYFPQKSGIETLMDTIKNNPIIQGALALASPLGTAAKGIGGFIGRYASS
jgi:hypothetical protein